MSRTALYFSAVLAILSFARPAEGETLLTTLNLEKGHVVQFFEFSPGEVAIKETIKLDEYRSSPALARIATERNQTSLSKIYKSLAKGRKLPTSLVRAERSIARQKARIEKFKPPKDESQSVSGPAVPAPPPAPFQKHGLLLPPTMFQPVQYWESWEKDAAWFLQNFCNQGAYRWCPTNMSWVTTGTNSGKSGWYLVYGMNASFTAQATLELFYWHCSWGLFSGWDCYWKKSSGSQGIANRTIVGWLWTSNGWRKANLTGGPGADPRVHLAEMWNSVNNNWSGIQGSSTGTCNTYGALCCPSTGGGASFYCEGGFVCNAGMCVNP